MTMITYPPQKIGMHEAAPLTIRITRIIVSNDKNTNDNIPKNKKQGGLRLHHYFFL
jgi:hypothetical protein